MKPYSYYIILILLVSANKYCIAQFNYEWAFTGGEAFTDAIYDITVDKEGNIYVVGTISAGFDFDPNEYTVFPFETAHSNVFFAKYTPNRELIFVKSFGRDDMGVDFGVNIAVDSINNIYLSGRIGNLSDMDPGPGDYIIETVSDMDGFVAKYDSSGNFIYFIDFNTSNSPPSISLGDNESFIAFGNFYNTNDFDPGPEEFILDAYGIETPYIAKYKTNGDFVYAIKFDTLYSTAPYSYMYISDVTYDTWSNIYITGIMRGSFDVDPGQGIAPLESSFETVFIGKYNTNGDFIYAKRFGTNAESYFSYPCIALDTESNIYITDGFDGQIDFDPDAGVSILTSSYLYDIFISKYDSTASLIYVRHIVGSGDNDVASALSIGQDDNLYISGIISGLTDFDPGPEEAFHDVDSYADMYIAKYDKEGNYITSVSMGGAYQDFPRGMALDQEGNIYLAGEFYEEINPFPGGEDYYYSNGYEDIFVAKYSQNLVSVTAPATTSLVADVKPNPGTGLYRINLPDAAANLPIHITDVTGTTVSAGLSTTGSEVLIDIQDAPAGVYFVQIGTGVASQTLKLMKL